MQGRPGFHARPVGWFRGFRLFQVLRFILRRKPVLKVSFNEEIPRLSKTAFSENGGFPSDAGPCPALPAMNWHRDLKAFPSGAVSAVIVVFLVFSAFFPFTAFEKRGNACIFL